LGHFVQILYRAKLGKNAEKPKEKTKKSRRHQRDFLQAV
jgi:hypothetical protein